MADCCVHYEPVSDLRELDSMNKVIAVAARVLLAQVYLIVGLQSHVYKSITDPMFYQGFQQYLSMNGLPGVFAPLMILVEIVGAGMLLLGWKTRMAAYVLAGYSLFIAAVFHRNFANPAEVLACLQYLAVAGGMLAIAVQGPGSCSLDNLGKK